MDMIFRKALAVMKYIANGATMGFAYKWGDATSSAEVKKCFEQIRADKEFGEDFWRKVFSLPEEEKFALGFRKFEEGDSEMCIPLWIWECLPDDMLFGGKMKKDLDNDTRFGCVWWRA